MTTKDKYKNDIYSKVVIAEKERNNRKFKIVVKSGEVVIEEAEEE